MTKRERIESQIKKSEKRISEGKNVKLNQMLIKKDKAEIKKIDAANRKAREIRAFDKEVEKEFAKI